VIAVEFLLACQWGDIVDFTDHTLFTNHTMKKPTKEKIIKMLKKLVEEVDYDIYKDIFVYTEENDSQGKVDRLVEIVEKYIGG
jgi:hypothetical protein